MTSASSIQSAVAILPEASPQKSSGASDDDGFSLFLSSGTDSDTKSASASEADDVSPDSEEKKRLEESVSFFLGLAPFCIKTPQGSPAVSGGETGETSEGIADILEGNDFSCDTDIASLVPGTVIPPQAEGNGTMETGVARMPQMTECLQSTDETATNTQLQSSLSCPLENISNTESAAETSARQADAVSAGSVNAAAVRSSGSESELSEGSEPLSSASLQTAKSEETTGPAGGASETVSESVLKNSAASGESSNLSSGHGEKESVQEIKRSAVKELSGEPSAAGSSYTAAQTVHSSDSSVGEAAVSNALERFSDMISSFGQQADGRFEIQLEPEYLGKLSISLTSEQDGIHAQIRTKDSAVQSLLSSEVAKLVSKLDDSGIRLKSVDVVCSDMIGQQPDGGMSGGFSGRESTAQSYKGSGGISTAYDFPGFESPEAWAETEITGCTVIFHA
ncbi:flagellar hook-length control protein FliK [Papillibacter cinnamivorans]|uniref:Flagellar hook-length control protein FliK n=1 Tax=Papillibacter cinnamivorans DSM 12816 TaxID=1122930 RepID=A0A1W1YHR3_9FIRM|nr:flagellar hook-length control protein FliK [Papillibacter cinnamivorans]SMC35683.1 Flagellar hook-length control protein FliK [Papillibacter cinnamivorans DSM 12816]